MEKESAWPGPWIDEIPPITPDEAQQFDKLFYRALDNFRNRPPGTTAQRIAERAAKGLPSHLTIEELKEKNALLKDEPK